jgi:antitoxin component HigA of HigAB toxin-antitoxin module
MEYNITSEKHYHETMLLIYNLMDKGSENLNETDTQKLLAMSIAAEKFEDEVLGLKPAKKPGSLSELIEQFMYENKISQANLANQLGIGKPKLSQILTGKRKPDVPFLKAIYHKLNVDPKFILDHI